MENFIYALDSKTMNQFAVPTFIAEQPCDDMAPDYLAKIGQRYGFLTALMGSAATQSIFVTEGGRRKYRQEYLDCDTGKITVLLGKNIWTELPEDIGAACCHTKPDVDGCMTKAFPMRLCLKDCYDDLKEHFIRMARQGFNLFGGTNAETEYMNELKAWFVFFQARDIMYGQVNVTGNNVPSFPGVLDIMNKATVSFSGADIIGVFEQIACRIAILGGNYVAGVHPMGLASLRNAVERGGVFWNGWSATMNTLTYRGVRFVEDINVPINVQAGTFQIWVADLNKVGVFMERNLSDPFVETHNSYQDSTTGDCFNTCVFLKNYGFAFTKDPNALFRIVDCPLDGACLGEDVLFGLGNLIEPDTLIPTYA